MYAHIHPPQGVAVYYLAPKWPFQFDSKITVDKGPSVIVDLTDHNAPINANGPETVQSAIVWSVTGLTNSLHIVEINLGDNHGVVDGFM
jgi:hypothetical protein